jgi:hypothetical protein
MVGEWSAAPVNCGDVATLDAPLDPNAVDQAGFADQIIGRWLELR